MATLGLNSGSAHQMGALPEWGCEEKPRAGRQLTAAAAPRGGRQPPGLCDLAALLLTGQHRPWGPPRLQDWEPPSLVSACGGKVLGPCIPLESPWGWRPHRLWVLTHTPTARGMGEPLGLPSNPLSNHTPSPSPRVLGLGSQQAQARGMWPLVWVLLIPQAYPCGKNHSSWQGGWARVLEPCHSHTGHPVPHHTHMSPNKPSQESSHMGSPELPTDPCVRGGN